jgi:hypothetical protein
MNGSASVAVDLNMKVVNDMEDLNNAVDHHSQAPMLHGPVVDPNQAPILNGYQQYSEHFDHNPETDGAFDMDME